MTNPTRDIAIVGMACRFPEAPDTSTFWRNIVAGKQSFSPIPNKRWDNRAFYSELSRDLDRAYVTRGGFLDDEELFAALSFGVSAKRAAHMDPQHRLLLEVTREAMIDGGFEAQELGEHQVGTFIGLSSSEYKNLLGARTMAMLMASGAFGGAALSEKDLAILSRTVEKLQPINSFSMPGSLLNMAAANIAHHWHLRGPAIAIDAACASALVAVHEAVVAIRAGVCDMAVAGGAYLNLTPENFVSFARIGAMSRAGVCRPFDAAADGFLQGEGAGVIILKPLEAASRDGDFIHAVIRGTGVNNDAGESSGPMAPSREGQVDVLRRAFADAAVDPRSVPFIECHGTATKVGDPVEVTALAEVLGQHDHGKVSISSVKGNIGHTMSAAGIAGLIKAVLVLEQKTIPPQAGFENPNPALPLHAFDVPTAARPWLSDGTPRRAGVSSFGFGGTNCHVVLEEAPSRAALANVQASAPAAELYGLADPGEDAPPTETQRSELVLLSAPTRTLLAQHCLALAVAIEAKDPHETPLRDLAYTLSATRRPEAARLRLIVRDRAELLAELKKAAEVLAAGDPDKGQVSAVCRYQLLPQDKGAPKVAVMFPGQGAQRLQLLRAAYDRFPTFHAHLDRISQNLGPVAGKTVLEHLYADLGDDPTVKAAAEELLQRTDVCQPVMAAVGLALFAWSRDLGITPSVLVGHSLGEYAAVAAAGMLGEKEAVALAAERGRLMQELTQPDPGAMAAVPGDADSIRPHLETDGIRGRVIIANINQPRQVVVSGATDAVELLMTRLRDAGIASKRLRVSHAFHSPLMVPAKEALAAKIAATPLSAPNIPVISATSGKPYDADLAASRRVLAEHATSSVDFVAALRACRELGADLFLQMGAGSVLTTFATHTLGKEARAVLGMASSDDDGNKQLLSSLGSLFLEGVSLTPRTLYPEARVVPLPAAPLLREKYWVLADKAVPLNMQAMGATNTTTAADAPSTATAGATAATPSPELLRLFREQAVILAQQTRIIAEQTAALVGKPVAEVLGEMGVSSGALSPAAHAQAMGVVAAPSAVAPVAGTPTPATAASPALTPAVGPTAEGEPRPVIERVLDVVAQVSAFPRSALSAGQSLATDLGFDSLMFVELGTKLQQAFPSAPAVPQSLLTPSTSIGDFATWLQSHVGAGPSSNAATTAAPAPAAPLAPVSRYRPVLVERSRIEGDAPEAPSGWILVTADEAGVADGIVERLDSEGLRVVLVEPQGDDQPNKEPTRVNDRVATLPFRLEPSRVPDLFALLGRHNLTPSGVVHVASSELRADWQGVGAAFPNPIPLATALATGLWESTRGRPELFVTVTGTGGMLGRSLEQDSGATVWQSGLWGFSKSLAREWPDANVRVIDIHPAHGGDDIAAQICDEIFSKSRDVEVALHEDRRLVTVLDEAPFANGRLDVSADDVVLVTGGGRGLGFIAAQAVAEESRCKLLVVGSATPREGDELSKNLATLSRAASAVRYVAWDIREANTPQAFDEAVTALGPVRVILHAAGVLRDGPVYKKSTADIDAVMGVKVQGLLNVLTAVGPGTPRLLVAFSSWAARFGNASQSDYAAANALVRNLLDVWQRSAAGRRVVAIDWPPWRDSGMVQKIPEILRRGMEAQGVTFLSDAEGRELFSRELAQADSGEVVYGRDLPRALVEVREERDVSVATDPYLDHHRLRGKPIMPFAMALDTLAAMGSEAAGGSHEALRILGLELVGGVEASEPVRLRTHATVSLPRQATNGPRRVHAELTRLADGRGSLAYRGDIEVGTTHTPPVWTGPSGDAPPAADLGKLLPEFYAEHSFHGPLLHGIDSVTALGEQSIEGWVKTSTPSEWLVAPRRGHWRIDPLAVDGAFQLVLFWLWQKIGRKAHPIRVDEVWVSAERPDETPRAPWRCRMALVERTETVVRGNIWIHDRDDQPLVVLSGVTAQLWPAEGAAMNAALAGPAAVSTTAPEPPADHGKNGNGKRRLEDLPAAYYDIAQFEDVAGLKQRFEMAQLLGLRNPYFHEHDGVAKNECIIDGTSMLNFSSYNYLGLSGHPAVSDGAKAAIERYGTSVSASRVASGQIPLHRELEAEISKLIEVESALVFSAGHHTNESVIGHLFGKDDLILHDALAHNSIQQGAVLSGAKRLSFPHNDWRKLEELLDKVRVHYQKCVIAIEGVYSMDGDLPDLPRFVELRNRYKSLLFVDEAHSIGVLGEKGGGIREHFGLRGSDVDMWMGTLSKSFASCGGYIAGSTALVDYLKYTVPGFVFSAGISPANAGAALAAIRTMLAEPERLRTLRERSKFFLELCRQKGIDTGLSHDSAVIPCIVGNSMHCLQLSANLAARGINVQPIVYPAVDDDAARLRFFLSSTHHEDELRRTVQILAEELDKVRRGEGIDQPDAASLN